MNRYLEQANDIFLAYQTVKSEENQKKRESLNTEFNRKLLSKYLATLEKLLAGKQWLVGDEMTVADLYNMHIIAQFKSAMLISETLKKFSVFQAYLNKLYELKAFQEYKVSAN